MSAFSECVVLSMSVSLFKAQSCLPCYGNDVCRLCILRGLYVTKGVGEGGREGEREERWREKERGGERERDRFLNSTEGKTAFRTWID